MTLVVPNRTSTPQEPDDRRQDPLPSAESKGPIGREALYPLVSPPSDDELYSFFGSQRRWVQLCMTAAFMLAALSLAGFARSSVWLIPLFLILAVNLIGSVASMLSGLNKRKISQGSHEKLVALWALRTDDAPSVDVYLPTCGEDMDVLLNTYRNVVRMEWKGDLNVWVLDDADRAEVRRAADAFGFHYEVRSNRGHMKKAGNLQNAFGKTTGEFIVILDADFCPRPDFLAHLMPYLDDPKVGIVQSPQYFDTTQSMSWLERTAGATQELFYRWVQPSRDRLGAPICVGTCAIYRRHGLEQTGGFAQIEHSEDVHTGIFLLRAGFRTQYVPILVSRGLCPSDLAGFINQQYRWCNGSITLLRSGQAQRNPLNFRQRLCFWAGFMYYLTTAMNVFAVHIPGMVMALFFASDVKAAHYVPFLAGVWVYFVLMPRVSKTRWRFEVLRVQMAYSFCHALAISHKLTNRTAGWVATGAVGRTSSLARTVSKLGLFTITTFLSVSWAAFFYDVPRYGLHEFWPMALFLAGYTYITIPLAAGFARILRPVRATVTGPVLGAPVATGSPVPAQRTAAAWKPQALTAPGIALTGAALNSSAMVGLES